MLLVVPELLRGLPRLVQQGLFVLLGGAAPEVLPLADVDLVLLVEVLLVEVEDVAVLVGLLLLAAEGLLREGHVAVPVAAVVLLGLLAVGAVVLPPAEAAPREALSAVSLLQFAAAPLLHARRRTRT